MEALLLIVGSLIWLIAWGLLTTLIFDNKGRDPWMGFALGTVLSALVIGTLVIILLWIFLPSLEKRGRKQSSLFKRFGALGRVPYAFAFHLAVARLFTQWRSLLTVIAGTILAASIGALVPLYTTAVAQVGMTQRLDQQPPEDVHVQSSISLRPRDWMQAEDQSTNLASLTDATTAIVHDLIRRDLDRIDNWVDDVVLYQETDPTGVLLVTDESTDPEPLIGMRARMGYYDTWEKQVQVVRGRLPQTPAEQGDETEVVIGLNVANELNLDVDTVLVMDDTLNAYGEFSDGFESSVPFRVRIVGVVTPKNENSPYWMSPSPLRLLDKRSGSGEWDYVFTFLTQRDDLYTIANDYLPDTATLTGWRILFNHDNLPFARVDEARRALRDFGDDMRYQFVEAFAPTSPDAQATNSQRPSLGFTYYTHLIDYDVIRKDKDKGILLAYSKEVALLDAPFGLLLLQVGALVIFFMLITVALVRRGERREIAMLQSRGAWDGQVVLLRGIEGMLICVIAVIVAPFLAQRLLIALGPVIANTSDFPLPLTRNVFVFAAAASSVTFLALMLTLVPVLRIPLIHAGGAAIRSGSQQWWQKYYIDVVFALIGLGALWLLVRNGSPFNDVNLGDKKADPLMLMAPALLFVALGSLALRLFPILARMSANITASGRGLLGTMASWQLSREPIHYGRITFLLSLAIGIGWFATSFRATVANSHADQAQYQVGTDARFVERDTVLNANRARPASYYEEQDNVAAASTAFRILNTNLSVSVSGELRGTILAVDPDTFGQTLYWRDDLGPIYTPRAPGDTPSLPVPGQEMPIVPQRIGMWMRTETSGFGYSDEEVFYADVQRLMQRTNIYVRLQDANGSWLVLPIEPVEVEYVRQGTDAPGAGARSFMTSGWVYGEADLSALEYEPVGPVRLVSVFWEYRSANPRGERGVRLTLADMSLIDANGESTPFPVFEDNNWEFLYDHGAEATGRTNPGWALPTERGDSIYFSWNQEAQRTIVGAVLNYPAPERPIDAVISRRMMEANGNMDSGTDAEPFQLFDVGRMQMSFTPVLVSDYFPTLYDRTPSASDPRGNSFMVVDARDLMYVLNRRPSATYYPDEVWLRLDEGVDSSDKSTINTVIRRMDEDDSVLVLSKITLADELDKLRTNPLGLGLLGLMYLAFIMALALSVVGLLTYAGLTAQSRRTEFGVLRALGLSSIRVVAGLALEQLFVMIIGVVLGSLLGWVLATVVVPTLALGATGENVIPPFVMRVETRRLLEYALMMLVGLGLVLSSSLLLVRQLSLARTLRLGEE